MRPARSVGREDAVYSGEGRRGSRYNASLDSTAFIVVRFTAVRPVTFIPRASAGFAPGRE
jgi:hypothetical protein